MKRIMALFVLAAFFCGIASGCAAVDDHSEPLTTQGNSQNPESTSSNTGESGPEQTTPSEEVTVAEEVIYASDGIKITVTGLEDGWLGPELKLLVENSTQKNITLSGSDFVVNGISISGSLYIQVAAGKKTNGELSFYSSDLETAGIRELAVIQAKDASAVDSDTFDSIREIPLEIRTSIAGDYVQELDESGEVILQESGITVIAKVIKDELFGKTAVLYMKNDTGKDVIVQAENVSVNGFTITAWMYDAIYAGTVRFCDLDLLSSELEGNGITQINEITFTLDFIDPLTYDRILKTGELRVFIGE